MRIFVAGATGSLGPHLVPGLVAAGHEVTATTRTSGKVAQRARRTRSRWRRQAGSRGMERELGR
jgi:uncharacterized protein YbjT (DUF2867 family)